MDRAPLTRTFPFTAGDFAATAIDKRIRSPRPRGVNIYKCYVVEPHKCHFAVLNGKQLGERW